MNIDAKTAEYADKIGCPDFIPEDGCIRFSRDALGQTHKQPCLCRVEQIAYAAVAEELERQR